MSARLLFRTHKTQPYSDIVFVTLPLSSSPLFDPSPRGIPARGMQGELPTRTVTMLCPIAIPWLDTYHLHERTIPLEFIFDMKQPKSISGSVYHHVLK